MNNFDLGRMLNRFTMGGNNPLFINRPVAPQMPSVAEAFNQTMLPQDVGLKAAGAAAASNTAELQMNTLQSMDRAVYAREVMQFPKNINEFIFMI